MSVTTWKGQLIDELSYEELVLARKSLITLRDIYERQNILDDYNVGLKKIDECIAQKQPPQEKVKFYITHRGETESINLYWFEENNIRTYEDLKQAGYRFTIDVGDNVSITI